MSQELLPAASYPARAVEWELGVAQTGTEQIAVRLQLTGPDGYAGQTVVWYGYFTEKTIERTVESLRHMGWQGVDLEQLGTLGDRDVVVVIEHEADTQGGVRARVKWINAAAGMLKQAMDPAERKSFAQRMRGTIAGFGQPGPAPARAAAPVSRAAPAAQGQRRPPEPPPHTDLDTPPF